MSKYSKSDLGYVAGIIDGEGCIMITKHQHHDRFEYQMYVDVSNTSLRIVNKIKGLFGGSIYSRERSGTNFRIHQWKLCGNKACEMLKKIKPFLQEKKEQADLAIQFHVYMLRRFHSQQQTMKLTEHDIKVRDSYIARLKELRREFLTPIALAETKCEDTPVGEAIVQLNQK
jgi:hypothetical protein